VEGVIEVGPGSEVPGQISTAGSVEKSKETAPEFDLGNGMKFSWKDESGEVKSSSKDCRHVLQANGGIIANC
jgi:hypothetical protein